VRLVVAARFLEFTETFEGHVEYMYQDVKGLVTIGFGNLIDPIDYALALPFVKKVGGAAATRAEITAEWNLIKDVDNKLQLSNQPYTVCAPLTALQLTEEAILALCDQRLRANDRELKKIREFQNLDEWPADAQLALHSMAWAMGPAFAAGVQWPSFRAACGKMDFDAAADNCRISEVGNRGVIPRNEADKTLFANAAIVLESGVSGWLNPDVLYYPAPLMRLHM
jgi:hypothetical protein